MSIADKLQHLGALNNRLGSYEERLASLVSALGGAYPVTLPEGPRSSNLTQTGADNDDLLTTFEGSNRFTVFVLDRVEQHLAHLQQYIHGERGIDAPASRLRDVDAPPLTHPQTVVIDGVLYNRA